MKLFHKKNCLSYECLYYNFFEHFLIFWTLRLLKHVTALVECWSLTSMHLTYSHTATILFGMFQLRATGHLAVETVCYKVVWNYVPRVFYKVYLRSQHKHILRIFWFETVIP